jgi:virulence-associated protein VapD
MNWTIDMNQHKWVIAYDLNVKGMRKAGYSKSKVTQYYNSFKLCLSEHGFGVFKQSSVYETDSSEQPLQRVYQIIDCLRQKPDPHFVNRLHLFKVEDFNDLRPLLPNLPKSEDSDPIQDAIDDIFPEDTKEG